MTIIIMNFYSSFIIFFTSFLIVSNRNFEDKVNNFKFSNFRSREISTLTFKTDNFNYRLISTR